ncbi:MAG: glycosyltransferase family 2 protein [Acidimicrobiales bacterium]
MTDRPDSSPRGATPSVLAVVVAHEPGEWFDDTLESLANQDYGRLGVLVVDPVGGADLAARRAVLPEASLLDASDTEGFSAAADAVLDTDVDPVFLLLCHDDIAPAPDAVRHLVTEALRSNAGITGPKLVDWHRPERLQRVAYVVDRFGVAGDVVDPGELDQEQYDAVGDVFAVPSACMLIRTDLFRTLGGFDPGIGFRGEDVDLCWRAQLAGARVVIVPDARVRHRGDLLGRTGIDDIRRTRARHQLRTVLVTGSRFGLLVTVPLMAVMAGFEALFALVTGRFSHVRDLAAAWWWNLRRLGEVRDRRRALRPLIRTRHGDVAALQQTGSIRLNEFVRGQIGRSAGRERFLVARTGTARIAAVVWALVLLFVVFGSRTVIREGVPGIGGFPGLGPSGGAMLREWWDGWRYRDLGGPGTGLSGPALLGALAWLTRGSLGFVRLVWILGPVLAGLFGAWRMLDVTGSRRAQMGALIAYAVVPLPWAALAATSITGLYGYACAPWILAVLLHAQASSPYRSHLGPWRRVSSLGMALGVTLGVGALFEPGVDTAHRAILVGIVVGRACL